MDKRKKYNKYKQDTNNGRCMQNYNILGYNLNSTVQNLTTQNRKC
jgi:hypothetical protein